MQHRKPSACDWALFRTGLTDSRRGYLDGPRCPRLGRLCGANLGNAAYGKVYLWSVFRSDFFHAGTPGRVFGWRSSFTKSEGGQPGVVLCASLVFCRAAGVATHNTSSVECEHVAQHSGGMGRKLQLLPEVLASPELPGRDLPLAFGIVTTDVMAYRILRG